MIHLLFGDGKVVRTTCTACVALSGLFLRRRHITGRCYLRCYQPPSRMEGWQKKCD